MKRYEQHLAWAEEKDPARHEELTRKYSRGWAVASEEFRKDLKKRYAATQEASGWGGPEVAELREEKWRHALERLMKMERKSPKDIAAAAKSAPWKVRVAKELRSTTTASNSWIAANLSMGHPTRDM
jgi:predicted secreted protein